LADENRAKEGSLAMSRATLLGIPACSLGLEVLSVLCFEVKQDPVFQFELPMAPAQQLVGVS